MSAQQVYVLRCDHPGCRETLIGSAMAGVTRTGAAVARWTSRRIKTGRRLAGSIAVLDFCPRHRDDAEIPEPRRAPDGEA